MYSNHNYEGTEYIDKGLVQDIRISTRPDYISELILKILKGYNVSVIELGVQSMDDEVLLKAKRGHTSEDVVKASELINKYGFELGHQVMVGLPESTLEKELETVRKSIELKPKMVRIYPVYVLKNLYSSESLYTSFSSRSFTVGKSGFDTPGVI